MVFCSNRGGGSVNASAESLQKARLLKRRLLKIDSKAVYVGFVALARALILGEQ